MSTPDHIRLAMGEIDGPVRIAALSVESARKIGANTRSVLLSKHNLKKQFEHHPEFEIHHTEIIQWIIETGEEVLDRKSSVIHYVANCAEIFGYSAKVTIKSTKTGNEVWFTSMHPIRDRDIKRLKRRARNIRLVK